MTAADHRSLHTFLVTRGKTWADDTLSTSCIVFLNSMALCSSHLRYCQCGQFFSIFNKSLRKAPRGSETVSLASPLDWINSVQSVSLVLREKSWSPLKFLAPGPCRRLEVHLPLSRTSTWRGRAGHSYPNYRNLATCPPTRVYSIHGLIHHTGLESVAGPLPELAACVFGDTSVTG